MSNSDAQRRVVLAVAVAGAASTAKSVADGDGVQLRQVVGVLTGGVMLAVLAEFSPDLAKPLATLMLLVAVLYTAPAVVGRLTEGSSS